MLKPRRHLPTYPDGVMEVYRKPSNGRAFDAGALPETLEGLEPVCTLCYSVEAMRERDIEFARQLGVDETLKLRCPSCEFVCSKMLAVIEGRIYNITRIDPSGKRELFAYLGGGVSVGGAAERGR